MCGRMIVRLGRCWANGVDGDKRMPVGHSRRVYGEGRTPSNSGLAAWELVKRRGGVGLLRMARGLGGTDCT